MFEVLEFFAIGFFLIPTFFAFYLMFLSLTEDNNND